MPDLLTFFSGFFSAQALQALIMPFDFDFMRRAFLVVAIVCMPMSLLSCYIVLKGWSLMGDAIAHAVLPGIVVAYMLAIPLSIGAFGAGLCCAVTTGFIKDNSRLREDTIMGIVFSGMFAVGIILFHKAETDLHLTHLLLGDVLGITDAGVIETSIIALSVLLVILVRGRDLMLLIFDPQQAQVTGISVRYWSYGLQILLALSIVAALQAVGMILSIALLIVPGACALLVTKRFSQMLWIAMAIALSCSLLGVYTSFFIDSAPAATIVLYMASIFCLLFSYKIYSNNRLVSARNNGVSPLVHAIALKAGQ
ncbi:MAG: iron (chelated) ABC transporter permease [Osedax symbiont Rs2]|nr:MAG: iron (chelated) ABC transporter permease [Osedax symbiont Rs2]